MVFEITQARPRHGRTPSVPFTLPPAGKLLTWASPLLLLYAITGLTAFIAAVIGGSTACRPAASISFWEFELS